MIKRTIDISSGPAKLSLKLEQMVLERVGFETVTIPCEDIGVLLIDHPAVSITQGLLTQLLVSETAVIICDGKHLPSGLLLPMAANSLHSERLRLQITAGLPLQKRLWRQIVRAKIRHQALVLGSGHPDYERISSLCRRVKSGDTSNVEAQAAKAYWKALFMDDGFHRDSKGDGLNALLNYGYAVLRAAVARAICASGLHPGISLYHKNRYNPFGLADDLMEPFRPMVDRRVKRLRDEGKEKIDKEAKAELLTVMTETVNVGETTGPFMVALPRLTASLCHCFGGDCSELEIPELWNYPDTEACGS